MLTSLGCADPLKLRVLNPSFAESLLSDAKENCEKKMAAALDFMRLFFSYGLFTVSLEELNERGLLLVYPPPYARYNLLRAKLKAREQNE